jgi:Peptidase propeptide and YPEB domain/Fungalysin/Thermolysin Propeptide Motif
MKAIYHKVVKPVLLAALVAGACNVMAAQRLNLASVNPTGFSQTANTIFTLTGLNSDELSLQYVEKLNGKNVARFQQFYRGIPVLGEAIVIKVVGDPQNRAPTLMSGTVLRNLDQDLPGIKPAISEKTALDQAKTLSRAQNISEEKVNLYIKQGANGAAALVYVVSFKNNGAAAASRPSYLIDATSGAVLDSWEGQEIARKFGPGDAYRKAFETLAQMPGWNNTKASQVIGYARDVYWTEGSKFTQGACGAEKAAADLGWNVADVRAAFNLAGTCHGSVAIDAIAQVEPLDLSNAVSGEVVRVNQLPSQAAAGSGARLTQRAINTGKLYNYTGWTNLGSTVSSLGSHGSLEYAKDRFSSVIGSYPTRPNSVCFYDYKLGSGGSNPCLANYSGWTPVQYRYNGTGTYSQNTVYTAWTAVPGYSAVTVPNYKSTAQNIGGYILYSSATATQNNWSVTTSVGIKIAQEFSVPLFGGAKTSVDVSLGVSAMVAKSTTTTITTNFLAPVISVPAGKAVKYQLVQQWKPVRTVWSVPLQFSGSVGADYGSGKWNGHYFWQVPATSYFYDYAGTGSEKATIVVDERLEHGFKVIATIVSQ